MATPAASSEDALIRFPVDSLSIEVSILLALMLAASAARIAALFVPIDKDIWHNSVLLSSYTKQLQLNG
jgi:hypothetical protein